MEKHKVFIFFSTAFAVLVAVAILFFLNNQPLDRETIKENLSDLSSYTNESRYIIQQYQQDKVSFIYSKTQLQFINKKVIGLCGSMTTTNVPIYYRHDVEQTEFMALTLSQQISHFTSSEEKKTSFPSEIQSINILKKKLQRLQKKYE